MMIIDSNGNYALVEGTQKPQTSEHPVYQARIEVALPVGVWPFAPTSGHNLARFARVANTPAKQDEFQKELTLYLKKYGPTVANLFTGRYAVELDLTIPEEALNV